jgi:Spy/CpxP family protein refolding chaperone
MRATVLLLGVVTFLMPGAATAQEKGLEAALAQHIYSPWVILEHRERLNLSEEQSVAIVDLMTEAEKVIVPAQEEIRRGIQTVVAAVRGTRIDVAEAISHFDEVMREESRIKRQHMILLMEAKNLLTPEQQATMKQILDETAGGENRKELGT